MFDEGALPPVSRLHLDALTDSTGILQHAIGARGDPAHGYCTDDVARALEVDLLHGRRIGWPAVRDRARANLRFLEEAFDPEACEFRNFRAIDRSWIDGRPSQDSQGRAFLALGSVIAQCPDRDTVHAARSLAEQALPGVARLTALRAISSALLGLDQMLDTVVSTSVIARHRDLAKVLHASFDNADAQWFWPEPSLTYENGLLARALIVAGRRIGSSEMMTTGLRALDWLLACQTAPDGHLSPIGNAWWPRGGVRSRFDQQPIEATALLRAAGSALAATGLERYRTAMEMAYGWFVGRNDLGIPVADPDRGACGDGLSPRGPSQNQGAESTLMWLIAVEEVRTIRAEPQSRGSRPVREAVLVA